MVKFEKNIFLLPEKMINVWEQMWIKGISCPVVLFVPIHIQNKNIQREGVFSKFINLVLKISIYFFYQNTKLNKPGRHCQSYKTILSTKHHEHIVEKLEFYLQCKNNPVTLAYNSNDEQKDTNLYHYCFCSTEIIINLKKNDMRKKYTLPSVSDHQSSQSRIGESESSTKAQPLLEIKP